MILIEKGRLGGWCTGRLEALAGARRLASPKCETDLCPSPSGNPPGVTNAEAFDDNRIIARHP